jgi:hypothetical protein
MPGVIVGSATIHPEEAPFNMKAADILMKKENKGG